MVEGTDTMKHISVLYRMRILYQRKITDHAEEIQKFKPLFTSTVNKFCGYNPVLRIRNTDIILLENLQSKVEQIPSRMRIQSKVTQKKFFDLR